MLVRLHQMRVVQEGHVWVSLHQPSGELEVGDKAMLVPQVLQTLDLVVEVVASTIALPARTARLEVVALVSL